MPIRHPGRMSGMMSTDTAPPGRRDRSRRVPLSAGRLSGAAVARGAFLRRRQEDLVTLI